MYLTASMSVTFTHQLCISTVLGTQEMFEFESVSSVVLQLLHHFIVYKTFLYSLSPLILKSTLRAANEKNQSQRTVGWCRVSRQLMTAFCQLVAEYALNYDASIGRDRTVEHWSSLAENLDPCLEARREREMFLD